eukprot:4408941-Amphidinium_carterae.1
MAQPAMGNIEDGDGKMACRLNGPEQGLHAADDRSTLQLHDGFHRRKRNKQGEAESDKAVTRMGGSGKEVRSLRQGAT